MCRACLERYQTLSSMKFIFWMTIVAIAAASLTHDNLVNYYYYDRIESAIVSRIYVCSAMKAKQKRYIIYVDFACAEYTANQWTSEETK